MANIEQIRQWCSGKWIAKNDASSLIEYLNIDSRNLSFSETSLFVTIKTTLRDGHSFIADAYKNGIRNFLVTKEIDPLSVPGANIVCVADSIAALQMIATNHRQQFDIPVIGITGSNGKTIVKEWLYRLIGDDYNATRSPKSYNSQIGVPLSVWQLNGNNRMGIFEAGISQLGEMEKLEKIIKPTIGIFTNIGAAHSEGFLNDEQKVNEKLCLFKDVAALVYCNDQVLVRDCINQFMAKESGNKIGTAKLFSWSRVGDATLIITKITKGAGKSEIEARYKNGDTNITIPFTDDASVENAIHCWCVMLLLDIEEQVIRKRMQSLQSVSMRLEMRHGINDCTIINDAYNSDLTSLQLALNFLEQQRQHSKHTVIMSDILEVGKKDADLYREVAALNSRYNISRFIGIGTSLYHNRELFEQNSKIECLFYKTTEEFLQQFHLLNFEKEAILLKGARVFAFEKIAVLLEQKVHQTVMSIDLPALRHNLDVFRGVLEAGVKTMAMVKAFAYGSGSYEIAGLLQNAGVDYLTVAYTDEGVSLRKSGIKMPIMVMSPDASSFDRMIAWKLEPELFNFRSLMAFVEMAETLQVKDYPIHIKLDTGMHRLGFGENDINELTSRLASCKSVCVASIFSHLAASEDPNQDEFTRMQASLFDRMSSKISNALGYQPMKHICNSAGIIRHHALHYNMVRLGIGLYGLDGSGVVQNKLHQISTLKTTIAQIRTVSAGESVGYGHKSIITKEMRIATICIGYADGYPRTLGNGKAFVLIHNKEARTIGSICMDMCMVDITNIPEAMEGDEVIVFGKDLSVAALAAMAGTIPYEIMTSISQRVKRVYINEE